MVVALGGDIIVLEVGFSVEGNLSGLDFSVFGVDFVSDEDDGDVFADSGKILVPFGDVLVGDSGSHVEHDDGTVCADAR